MKKLIVIFIVISTLTACATQPMTIEETSVTEMTFEAEITSEIVDTSKPETKELSEKELLSEYIEYYKEYFKDNYSENPTEEVSVFFCDFDDDGKYEASLRYPELWIKNYNEATKTVEEMREWGHISGANKYRLASGEEIYIYQPDNQFLFYSQFENGRYVGGEYLLGNAYFDDRVKKEVTYFYFVGDIATEGLDTPIEYVNSRIEHEPIKDNLVTKETYEKVIKEFYEKTEPVPVCIKTLSMTVDEWLTLSTEEILEKTEDDVLASELPEHKIDEGEDYEN